MEGVPVAQLPLTFQDAITVTRHLGFEFIWIDSLCILQDSREDWLRESSLMGKVYSQGVCNIGAIASASGSEGCFRQRDPLLLDRTVIETAWTDQPNGELHLFLRLESYRAKPPPLLRRGWVVQEQFLSHRFLHFDTQQVIFECKQGYVSEMYPAGVPSTYQLPTGPLTKADEPHALASRNADFRETLRVYNYWARLVERYTVCHLTVETDRLVAISGIAKALQGTLHEDYYAGLWKGQLPQGLLWIVEHDTSRSEKERVAKPALPSSYLAPSWSWASIIAAIEFHRMSLPSAESVLAEVLQIQTVPSGSDPTGQISSGFIRLRGKLWTVLLQGEHPKYKLTYSMYAKHKFRQSARLELKTVEQNIYIDNPSEVDSSAGGVKMHFMPIWTDLQEYQSVWFLHGLLLLPAGKRGQFRRVGVFVLWEENGQIPLDRLVRSLAANNSDGLEYEDFDGENYTITIV
jgi:Heterokaryon incompatibility protein (HET)